MSDVRPSMAQLAEAVREHLERDVVGRLDGKAAYELRVAANVLAIVQREAELGPQVLIREQERLAQLLGQSGDTQFLNSQLADRIRQRELGPENRGLLQHLRATVIERLGIDNPKYSAYLRAVRRADQASTRT
jgi:hypothetical protein